MAGLPGPRIMEARCRQLVHRSWGTMRILIVQTAFLGDIVLTTPLLRELRRVHPGASLWVLTTETGRRVLADRSGADHLLVLDKRWNGSGVRSCGRLLRQLIREPFDAAVAAHRSIRTGMLVRLSGAPLRVGFARAPGAWAYNQRVVWDPEKHAAQRYLDLAGPLGGEPARADPRPELAISPAADRRVGELLRAHRIPSEREILCLAPGSVWATKRWVPEGFAEVLHASRRLGLTPVLIGSPGERELCERVNALTAGEPAPVLAGHTGVRELIALLARARVLVGNDSGPAHVAAAVGTPVVTIFGSTAPALGYAAFGAHTRVVEHPSLACRPCGSHGAHRCPLGHLRCMREVRPSAVLDRLSELLSATRPDRRPADVVTSGAGGNGRRLAETGRIGQRPPVVVPG